VRIIDELPDVLFERLSKNGMMTFRPLPPIEDEPPDEKTDSFKEALSEARLTDEAYLKALEDLDPQKANTDEEDQIERALKDRVRTDLGLPPRPKDKTTQSLVNHAKTCGLNPDYDLPHQDPEVEKLGWADKSIQTLLLDEMLDRKMRGLVDLTRSAFQESGINTLFAAFGFLEWRENDSAETPRFAPLILLPVEIKRNLRSHKYVFEVEGADDDPIINRTLQTALKQMHGLDLPELGPSEYPESYFRKLSKILEAKPKWKVRRWITFGVFPFSRMAMYYDLDPERWPNELGIAGQRAVRDLIYGKEDGGGDTYFADEYDVDKPEIESLAPLLITEADSSQHSAVVDVMKGNDLAVKGPPGTGKSQTIANIIANALAADKTVLFVAEKLAALEVVARRLEKFELGRYVLELHSYKARRADILKSFERRLQSKRPATPADFEADLRELKSLRTKLSRYTQVLNSPYGESGKTIQQMLWAEQRSRNEHANLPVSLQTYRIENSDRIEPHELIFRKEILERVAAAAAEIEESFTAVSNHPWRGVGRFCATPIEERQVVDAFDALRGETMSLLGTLERMRDEFGIMPERRASSIQDFITKADGIPESETCPNLRLASRLADPDSLARIEEFRKLSLAALETLGGFSATFQDPFSLDPDQVRRAHEAWLLSKAKESTPETLTERARSITLQTDVLENLCSEFARLAEIVHAEQELSPAAILTFSELIEFVARHERDIFVMRHAALLSDRASAVLNDAQTRAEAMAATRKTLDERFFIDDELVARDLRDHARELRGTGLFSAFSSSVKAAKRAWQRLNREPRKIKTHMKAAELDEIAEYLEIRTEFLSDEAIQATAGPDWRGLKTDFAALLRVCLMITEGRSQFSRPDALHSMARKLICEGDMVVIDAAIGFASDPAFSRIQEAISHLPPDDRRPLSEMISEQRSRSHAIDHLARTAIEVGFRPDGSIDVDEIALGTLDDCIARLNELANDEFASQTFGEQFKGAFTDFSALDACADYARTVVALELPEDLEERVFESSDAAHETKEWAHEVERAFASWDSAGTNAARESHLDADQFCGEPFGNTDLRHFTDRLKEAIEAESALASWGAYVRARAEAARANLDFLCEAFIEEDKPLSGLPAAYERLYAASCTQHIYSIHTPELADFSGVSHQQNRRRFQELDRKILKLNRAMVSAAAHARPVPAGVGSGLKREYTNLALLRNEIGKKARHIPIRELIRRAGGAMQELKPCFMMSPNSVAQYIPPATLRFDLVIIDEASQMRPEEALGAIARADQAVIVGDEQQLPPTSFFMREQFEDSDEIDIGETVQEESILDLALSCFRPARDLRWHYRSRHESLIAFSNNQFYDERLQLFPSPMTKRNDFGVQSHYVPGAVYKSGLNRKEADTVIDAVTNFMHAHPDRSLGVATMNHKQREYIIEEIDRLATTDDAIARYIARWESELEDFFVKNLENVQGDERDVIFVSTVYGPETEGGKVHQRFGPINSVVGHRRLNVLFTRARENLVLFTSMHANDIKVTENSTRGLRALRAYLEYAETGRLVGGEETGREPDSDFEVVVKERLEAIGCEAIPQVGVHGYFIDLGVKHPRYPHGFLLGIECDGATYHSARSTRDRDRLRQEVLEGLDWDIYRIWSTDWFRDPNGEFARLKSYINQLLEKKCGKI